MRNQYVKTFRLRECVNITKVFSRQPTRVGNQCQVNKTHRSREFFSSLRQPTSAKSICQDFSSESSCEYLPSLPFFFPSLHNTLVVEESSKSNECIFDGHRAVRLRARLAASARNLSVRSVVSKIKSLGLEYKKKEVVSVSQTKVRKADVIAEIAARLSTTVEKLAGLGKADSRSLQELLKAI